MLKPNLKALAFAMFVLFEMAPSCHAQNSDYNVSSADPFFPRKGKFQAALLITYSPVTPPPAIIGEVTYGVSRRFSVAAVGGTTGALAVYGVRTNARLIDGEKFNLLFRFLSVYYPERDGRFMFDRKDKYVMPWMLSMAVTDAVWKTEKGNQYSLGLGAIETHCIDDMKMWFNPNHDHHAMTEEGLGESLIDLFATIQGSVSVPVSHRITLRLESFAVFRSGRLIEREKFKVTFPVNSYVQVFYSF